MRSNVFVTQKINQMDINLKIGEVFFFSTGLILASGATATVFPASNFAVTHRDSADIRQACKVVKVIYSSELLTQTEKEFIVNEYRLSLRVKHLGIKRPLLSRDGKMIYLIMNYLPGETLHDFMSSRVFPQLHDDKLLAISYQLLRAVYEQVSSLNIIHGDLKPENIMILPDPLKIHIFDFGGSMDTHKAHDQYFGTPIYTSPERFLGVIPRPAADVYSIAKVITMLWIKDNRHFEHYDVENIPNTFIHATDFRALIPEITEAPHQLQQLLIDMLNPNPARRISIKDAIDFMAFHFPQLGQSAQISRTESKTQAFQSPGRNLGLFNDTEYSTKRARSADSLGQVGSSLSP